MKALRIPVWTLAICAFAAVVFGAPPLEALLVYNREAIERGELWRLLTGNLVHLSSAHLARDLIALLVAGALIETRYRHFPVLCLASGLLIGAVLYLAEPGLLVYGGMSGIVTAAVAYFCLNGLMERCSYRWLYLAVLACLTMKTGVELLLGASTLAGMTADEIVLVPASHGVGAATALALFATASLRGGLELLR